MVVMGEWVAVVVNGGGGFVVCQWRRWSGLILWCLFGISWWLQWFWIDLSFRWLKKKKDEEERENCNSKKLIFK